MNKFLIAYLMLIGLFFSCSVWAQEENTEVVERETVSYEPRDPRQEELMQLTAFEPELETQIPTNLVFRNEQGVKVPLSTYINGELPVILNIIYYNCPSLCNLQLNGLLQTMNDINYTVGQDFKVLAISFFHEETHLIAAGKRQNYIDQYNREGTDEGWHFLVGDEENIKKLTETVNFGFVWDERSEQYAHKSGLLILTPEGKLSRFLPDVMYAPKDLRLAIVEAGEGKIGTLVDKISLLCYQYDPEIGKYGVFIDRSLKVAGLSTVGLVLGLIIYLFRREARNAERNNATS